MVGKNLAALFFLGALCMAVPDHSLAILRVVRLNNLAHVDQFQVPLGSAATNVGPRMQIDYWDRGVRDTEKADSGKMDSERYVVAISLPNEKTANETSQPHIRQLEELVRKGKLDEAFELITKGLEEVDREDPKFFYLNLYAGEFLVQKRNTLINGLLKRVGRQQGLSGLRSFGTQFAEHLPEYEKPEKEALKYLSAAWENMYLVSEKHHQMAVKRLTDAFFALVQPYITYTLFAVNSDNILDTWLPSLSRGCALLNQIPIGKIYLEGHTDDTGPADHNLDLSKRRAESVKRYLVRKGIRENLITATGKGETSPIASNDTPEGRARNRRVEIVLTIRFQTY